MFRRVYILLLLSIFFVAPVKGQEVKRDILPPVSRCLSAGDVDSLSNWFDDALEISIFSKYNDSSCNQARQILQSFFSLYTPRNFEVAHIVDNSNIQYVLGSLTAGGEQFVVTLFISKKSPRYLIQQLKIDKTLK